MLAVEWNAPVLQELLKFWPLALVATGMAMLLVQIAPYARRIGGAQMEAITMSSLTRGTRGLIFGIIVVLAGVTLLLDQMNLIDANRVFRFWPLVLVALGISTLLTCRSSGRRFSGGFLILAGIGLQLQELGFARVRIETLWPIFIIAVGVLLVIQAFGKGGEPLLNRWKSKNYETGPEIRFQRFSRYLHEHFRRRSTPGQFPEFPKRRNDLDFRRR